jgi:hypothetical protein
VQAASILRSRGRLRPGDSRWARYRGLSPAARLGTAASGTCVSRMNGPLTAGNAPRSEPQGCGRVARNRGRASSDRDPLVRWDYAYLLAVAEWRTQFGAFLRGVAFPTAFLACAIASALLSWATPADAQGGATIATAPALTSGVTVSGNTAADTVISHTLASLPCVHDEELWTLNLVAGEHVLLKGQLEAPANEFTVEAVPPGISESTLVGTSPISGVSSGSLQSGVSFSASKSGTWLIVVGASCEYGSADGPYQLTAQGPRPQVAPKASRLVVHRGRLAVPISCSHATCSGSVDLVGQITYRHRRGHRTVTRRQSVVLAVGTFSLGGGRSETLDLTPTAAGKGLLTHAYQHNITARLTLRAKGGNVSATTVVVT